MNRYVSASERDHLLRLGAVVSAMEESVADYEKSSNVDKIFMRYLKTTGTYAMKCLKIRFKYLEPDSLLKIERETKKNTIAVKPKSAALVEEKRIAEANKTYHVPENKFLDLLEITIERTCQICTGEKEATCPLKKMLLEFGVEVFHPDAKPGECPYHYVEVNKDGESNCSNTPAGVK